MVCRQAHGHQHLGKPSTDVEYQALPYWVSKALPETLGKTLQDEQLLRVSPPWMASVSAL